LKDEHKKHQQGYDPEHNKNFKAMFKSQISLSYSEFEYDEASKTMKPKGYALSQALNGMISNITLGEYEIPKDLRYLNYRTGSKPLLPYS
jgi:hypothetical protein